MRHGAGFYEGLDDVHVRSGADGALLLMLDASQDFPHCVAAGPDLDLDGHADIILGRPFDGVGVGNVHAFSGADGHELWVSSYDPKTWSLGPAIAALDDENADGIVDVLVGLPNKDFGIGRAELLSGADGAVIYDVPAPADWDVTAQYGLDLHAGQDVDGDGAADAIVLAPGKNMLVVLSGSYADNVAPVLAGVGDLAPGSTATVSITRGVPGGKAALLVGFVEFFLPLKGGFLEAKPDVIVPLVLNLHGAVSFDASVPAGMPSGFTLWMQSWHPDPGGPQGYKASNTLKGLTK